MYQLTSNPDIVRCTTSSTFIPNGHRMWAIYEAWVASGNTALPVESLQEMASEERHQLLRSLAREWMASHTRRLGHDSVESCCSYINSGVPRYAQSARAMIAWRDAVSIALDEISADWPAGMQTWEQVRTALPQPHTFDWPKQEHTP
ncbi:TPA: hypothetical protein UOJ25_002958 [Stenotrophomonas maltophilia]|nr:hypothetical protein [Stenotrophomonas maltophilia]